MIVGEEGQVPKGKRPGGVLLSGEDKEDLVLAGKTNKKPNVWRLEHRYSLSVRVEWESQDSLEEPVTSLRYFKVSLLSF